MQLQRATEEHADAISDLDLQLFDNGFGPSTIRRELQVGWGVVALEQGVVIGYVLVRPDAHLHDLTRLATHQDHRRRGIGRALFRAARAAHPGPMMLFVKRSNPEARALYAGEGFRVAGVMEESWLMLG